MADMYQRSFSVAFSDSLGIFPPPCCVPLKKEREKKTLRWMILSRTPKFQRHFAVGTTLLAAF